MSSSWAFPIGPRGPYSSERSPSRIHFSRWWSTKGILEASRETGLPSRLSKPSLYLVRTRPSILWALRGGWIHPLHFLFSQSSSWNPSGLSLYCIDRWNVECCKLQDLLKCVLFNTKNLQHNPPTLGPYLFLSKKIIICSMQRTLYFNI